MEKITIHDIEGFNIGHAENRKALTGCTVILCEEGQQVESMFAVVPRAREKQMY